MSVLKWLSVLLKNRELLPSANSPMLLIEEIKIQLPNLGI